MDTVNPSRTISLGLSSCPNDTGIFYALLHKKVQFSLEINYCISDIEELNKEVIKRNLDVSKISYGVLDRIADDYVLLRSGSALGRGCGPLILGREKDMTPKDLESARIAIPGVHTTAALLLRLYCPGATNLIPMNFAKIAQAVADGDADAGVIIHETRFVYHKYGLALIRDLGAWWEELTGLPIPLGGIAAKRRLGRNLLQTLNNALKFSVLYAMNSGLKGEILDFVRRHAQEMSPEVMVNHIKLYVNHYTVDVGEDGLKAVELLTKATHEKDIFRQEIGSLFIEL
ncbi:MAG: 1,4-dihydroxy-6-naphthoate synthase [Dissulfurimicrobium sp.]|uniref:1,4-dihydroxy-6-naphthoate synthase n=1 Tax=Dissulfurimicrobium TaxID=1769732 RepID=UPI001EDA0436|nr:1,4-dihydroxy-6-naphthoate synthase [Dissulfurimicrobium hydrothermale]UKL14361.1 1,4-dihydroxy-6-naphthoate synthase [Dissulfurimicrobium hydrothermale]